jgi:hypothetical protein
MTDLTNRYGAPSPARRRALIGFVGVIAVVALGWLAWAAIYQSNPKVRSDEASFEVVDEHTVQASITVVRQDTDTVATCYLRALAEDHSIVGEGTPKVDTGPKKQTVTVNIRTERRATAVESLGCTAPGQNQRR